MAVQQSPQRIKLFYMGGGAGSCDEILNQFLKQDVEVVDLDFVEGKRLGAPMVQVWYRESSSNSELFFKHLYFTVTAFRLTEIEEKVNSFLAKNNAQRVASRFKIGEVKATGDIDKMEVDLSSWGIEVLLVYTPL